MNYRQYYFLSFAEKNLFPEGCKKSPIWSMVIRYLLSVIRYLLFVICYLLSVIRYSLSVIGYQCIILH